MISVLLTALAWLVITLLCAGVLFACGRLFFWRQVTSPGALFVALTLVMFGVSNLMQSSPPGTWPALASIPARSLLVLFFASTPIRALFFLYFCVFPGGRLVWRETRWLLVLYAVVALGLPFPFTSGAPAAGFSQGVPNALHALAIGIALIPQLVPYRDLSAVGARLRGAWVLVGLGVSVVVLVISAWLARAADLSLPVVVVRIAWYLVASLVPVALGLAVQRARLYDRAALIRRALIYGLLSVGLTLAYVAGMAVLPALFDRALVGAPRGRAPDVSLFLANLLCILIMALLFQPLHHLLQRGIDHRFYRHLYETARSFAAFGTTVHQETRVDSLSQQVIVLLQATLCPRAVDLWVRMHLTEEVTALPGDNPNPGRAQMEPGVSGQRAMELYRCPQTDGAGAEQPALTIRPDDSLRAALLRAPGPVALAHLVLSPAASALRDGGVGSAVPLVDRGEVVGLVALSDPLYSFDVRELLAALGARVAPALGVAQRIHEQERHSRERERVEQELQMARRIQQSFLPHAVPSLDGWQITSHYRPAREVGGDFYDVLVLADGRLGLIVGDVTDKGVPAALVMAATRSMLRAAAQHQGSPGAVLAQVSDLLCPDVPAGMFVTCFYAILEPATGHLCYANAGHELPYHRHEGTVTELFATGLPLGLLPAPLGLLPAGRYEEGEAVLQPGDTVLLYSDGLVEAHDRQREMFGRTRLARLVGEVGGDTALIDRVLHDLAGFTPPDWEQEDDITLLTLHRRVAAAVGDVSRVLDAWSLPSVPGNERLAMRRVRTAIQGVHLGDQRLAQLETAVAEATLNAMEHGNGFQADQMVEFQVLVSPTTLTVRIGDQGSGPLDLPASVPDLAAKLAGEQAPRGWGLYLIKHLVDDLRLNDTLTRHTVELRMALSEGSAPGAASDQLVGAPPLQHDSMTSQEPGATSPAGSTDTWPVPPTTKE